VSQVDKAFNSLSRDHLRPYIDLPLKVQLVSPFNSLSRDHLAYQLVTRQKDWRGKAFNSLSRDHGTAVSAQISSDGFQLPLSGSQVGEKMQVMIKIRRAFNSLSRDHNQKQKTKSEKFKRLTPFNSLSRDHRVDSFARIILNLENFQLPLSGSRDECRDGGVVKIE